MSTGKLPATADGLQLNFCKTLACRNFGLSDEKLYLLQYSDPTKPALVCKECGAFPPLLNNQAALDELDREKSRLSSGLAACGTAGCQAHGKPVINHRQYYQAFGFSGERQRYRCKMCKGTFVDKWSNENQKSAIQQRLVAYLLTGHPVREICRTLSLNPKTFYDHVAQIAARCRHQLSIIDARFLSQTTPPPLASAIADLQPDSQNGVMWIATGCAKSGYVLLQNINFSPTEDPGNSSNDITDPAVRLMPDEFIRPDKPQSALPEGLLGQVDSNYHKVFRRSNVEDPYTSAMHINYPATGSLIRPQYTAYGQYLNLKEKISHWPSLTLYIPQEPLLRSASMSVFKEELEKREFDPVYVSQDSNWIEGDTAGEIDIVMLSWWRDRWAFTHKGNAAKAICYLGKNSRKEAYWLEKASYREVEKYQDLFHQQFSSLVKEPRRRLRPGGLLPLLDIYRAWRNLCWQNKHGETPAQQLGLVTKPMTLEDLLS